MSSIQHHDDIQIKADEGDAVAQCKMGTRYYNGIKVARDENRAIMYWTLSADQGNSEAQYELGSCYLNGDSVEQNIEKTIMYWTLSANQGNSEAQYELASCYSDGDGVEQDMEQAIRLYTLSANQGHRYAIKELDSIRRRHTDVKTSVLHEQCSICMDNKKCVAFDCGHVCTCFACATQVRQCPLCRMHINQRKVVYI